jgi:Flp pilus assembly protein TadD
MKTTWLLAGPALTALLVYAGTLFNGFAYDDAWTWQSLERVREDWPSLLLQLRGLTYWVHLLDLAIWGDWAPGFHLTNLCLHAGASSLAALAAFHVSGSRRIGLVCGMLFAVHPVHVEAVASFANRKDILAMIFTMLSLILWIEPGPRVRQYARSVPFLALALLSKEVAAVGVVALLPFARWIVARRSGEPTLGTARAVSIAPALLLVGAGFAAILFGRHLGRYFDPGHIFTLTEGALRGYREVVATSAAALPDVFRLLLFPLRLSADYPVGVADFGDARAQLGIALSIAWLACAAGLVKRAPAAAFSMLWVVAMYLPHSNLIPLTRFFLAERYLYVPSFGICLLIAVCCDAAVRRAASHAGGKARLGLAIPVIALIAAGAARSALRVPDWRDTETLMAASLEAGIDTWRIRRTLGVRDWNRRDFAGAVEHRRRATELQPLGASLRFELAAALIAAGRDPEGQAEIQRAMALHPDATILVNGRGVVGEAFLRRDKDWAASEQFRRAMSSDPANRAVLERLAWILATSPKDALRDGDEATRLAERAIASGADDARIRCALAAAQAETGAYAEALATARHARELARSSGDPALTALAEAMLASFEKRQPYRLPARAVADLVWE